MTNPMYLYAPIIGFLVGGLVAATGVGGGILLLPLQVMGLRVPPIVAVGSDITFMFFTKLWATIVNWKRENLDRGLAIALLTGSIPGSLVGIALLNLLRLRWGSGVNSFLRDLIGVLLVVIPVLTLAMDRIKAQIAAADEAELPSLQSRRGKAALVGLVGGFLVGLTSVGSGSVIILMLFLFYRRSTVVLVGTDIFHGMILSGMLGLIHVQMGTVDFRLVALLMAGAVVGVPFGAKLATLIPSLWLRRAVLLLLIPMGIKLL